MPTDTLDFDRPVPLFPLPNLVLFPGVVQPLHIFEPRYRAMVADTLADQSLLASALLQPGWEKDYYGSPALHPIVCVGKIAVHETVEDGKYNLLLQGLLRAAIVSEARHGLYRTAMLRPILDPPMSPQRDAAHRKTLTALVTHGPLAALAPAESVRTLLTRHAATARVVDFAAFALLQDIPAKQRLLEQPDPALRAQDLIAQLVELAKNSPAPPAHPAPAGPWPPPLSTN